jgi:hypothetical protein
MVTDQGATAIGDALKVNGALTSLWLINNKIGDQGASAIGEALKVNGAVELQGLGDRRGALVADLVGAQPATRGKRTHGQQMVKEWSRNGEEMVKGVGSKSERILQRFKRATDRQDVCHNSGIFRVHRFACPSQLLAFERRL